MGEQRCASDRKRALDFLKYICAFLVICIHTDFPGKTMVDPVARIAVPVFFMITGYNYTRTLERKRQWAQIKRTLAIAVSANLLYLVWELMMAYISSGGIRERLASWMEPETWLRLLLLNESPFSTRLWYMGALVYVLAILYWVEKKGSREQLYGWIPVLLGANLALGTYSPVVFGRALPLEYSRNFLFIGLPCFLLGDLLYRNREKKYLSDKALTAILVAALVATEGERYLLDRQGLLVNRDFYFATILLALGVFLLVNRHERFFHRGLPGRIAVWGQKLSLGIYLYNKIVRVVIYKFLDLLPDAVGALVTALKWASPVVVLVGTSVLVSCMNRLSSLVTAKCRRWE